VKTEGWLLAKQIIKESDKEVFLKSSFNACGSRSQVSLILNNLIKEGSLMRISKGIYVRSRIGTYCKTPVPFECFETIVTQTMELLGVEEVTLGRALQEYRSGETTQIPARLVINTGKRRIRRKIYLGDKILYYEN
jgi:hypothetical protein